ncbi:MAG TPA: UDP-3-O-acyl-N-acetylglucosamine deacetylase [Gemmatimonadales bacterium]|nr:UDP-3-O-acyl-N-acetylglucosamine deacetylase [Gemmatimonadales bacterium]
MPRRTIARPVEITGTGLHSGAQVSVRLEPAAPGAGIAFERRDLSGTRPIPARLDHVAATERRTALRLGAHRADTVEHLLAAIYAQGIDDLVVALLGPEVPILDGSFAPFVSLLDEAGHVDRPGATRRARLGALLRITEGDAHYIVSPHEVFGLEVTLEYLEPVIGRQTVEVVVTADSFRRDIQRARTYGFLGEIEPLRGRGLLAGAGAECGILLDEGTVLNTTLRWPDEFARHKAGDLIGDLALLEARLTLRIAAYRPSHRGNLACARAIAHAAHFTEEA